MSGLRKCPPGAHRIHRVGTALDLIPGGGLLVEGTLAVSDLHWGKGESFQRSGIAAPRGSERRDAERLLGMVNALQAEEIVVVGDVLHARAGWTPRLAEEMAAFIERLPVPLRVVLGNHDRGLGAALASTGCEVVGEELLRDGIAFRHEPEDAEGLHVVAGHLHPVVVLRSRHDRLRLPVFVANPGHTVLPSFGAFTGGCEVDPARGGELFTWDEERVLAL